MTEAEWSRHHHVRAGSDFFDAIWLVGFDQQSTWGYDTNDGSFFAQIWRNGSRGDSPDLWLTAPRPLSHPECVVAPIVEHTGHDPLGVVRALGIAHPAPRLRTIAEIDEHRSQYDMLVANSFTRGARVASGWLNGGLGVAPLSESRRDDSEHPAPDAAVVDAEASFATGVVYLTNSDYAVGVETMLVYATSSA